MSESKVAWLEMLSVYELRYALIQCVAALEESGQVAFRYDDIVDETGRELREDEVVDVGFYWKDSGELITDPIGRTSR
jgi:hypothetical protein